MEGFTLKTEAQVRNMKQILEALGLDTIQIAVAVKVLTWVLS